jgi:hypothetical protein
LKTQVRPLTQKSKGVKYEKRIGKSVFSPTHMM